MSETSADHVPGLPTEIEAPPPNVATVDVNEPQSLWLVLATCIAFAVLADWLFWQQPLGWTLGAYGLLLTIVISFSAGHPPRGRAALLVAVGTIGLLLHCFEQPGRLTLALSLLGLATLALTVREGWSSSAYAWVQRWGLLLALGWRCVAQDLIAWNRQQRASGRPANLPSLFLRHWFVPVLLAIVFCTLFAIANPVIARWLADAWRNFRDWLSEILKQFPTAARLAFWALVALSVWIMLRFRSKVTGRAAAESAALDATSPPIPSAAFVVRCLALFNVIFAVQTVLDVQYLWGHAALPEGLTYAQYAHRGAYPLVAAAILAAVFVLAVFRAGSHDCSMTWARRLVYLWLLQNLFLVVSAAWRLRLYVDVYSLTRLRIATAVWMLLVLCGLAWILLRILARRSNAWLFNVNTLTALAVLFVCAFVDFDGFIADFNVTHCRELRGAGPPIDVLYLGHLGPEALPALARLLDVPVDPLKQTELRATIARLQANLQADLASWRGWTWRRHRLAQLIFPEPRLSPAPTP